MAMDCFDKDDDFDVPVLDGQGRVHGAAGVCYQFVRLLTGRVAARI